MVARCKFAGALECLASERSRQHCHACPDLQARLSACGRIEREFEEMRRQIVDLEATCHGLRRLLAESEAQIAALMDERVAEEQ